MSAGEAQTTRPPRRDVPLRYVLGLVAACFAVPIVAWVIWGWIEASRLDRVLDALEARHEPLDLAEFAAKPTTAAEKEASHLYTEAGRLIGERAIPSGEAARISAIIGELCSSPDTASRAAHVQELRAFEDPYVKAFELIDRARPLKAVGWDDMDRPQRQTGMFDMRPITLNRANVARIARLACTGDTDGAAAALLSTLRMRRIWSIGAVPPPTAHSLALTLTSGSPSPALLQQIQEEYATTADDRTFENWILRERAFWLASMLPGVFSDAPSGYDSRRITPGEAIVTRLVRPLRDHRTVAEIREFDDALEVAKQPWPSKFDAIRAFAEARPVIRSQSIRVGPVESLSRPMGAHFAANVLTSYVGGMAEALARARASVGAVAVARYRRDHAGAVPQSLQALMPQYLSSPLIDPFSGSELKFRRGSTGYRIYSVGANRKDDGGEWEQYSDLQLSRRGNPLDIGIEVGVSSPKSQ